MKKLMLFLLSFWASQIMMAQMRTCPGMITGTSHTDATCAKMNDGSITILPAGLGYIIGTVSNTSSPNNTFSNLTPGSYHIQVKNQISQTLTCYEGTTVVVGVKFTVTESLSKTDESCMGKKDGTITATGAGGTPPYQFKLGTGGTYSTNNLFTNLRPGTYKVFVKDASGCGNTYVSATIDSSTTVCPCPQQIGNLIVNGDFCAGNTGFSTQYINCNTQDCLSSGSHTEGGFAIGKDANFYHGAFQGHDHTNGTGNFMIVNGSLSSNVNVWCETVNVNPNTSYKFSYWLSSMYVGDPATLQVFVNGVPLGSLFTAPNPINKWRRFIATWNSGSSSTASICIVDQNTRFIGNDFGLDDISFVTASGSSTKPLSTALSKSIQSNQKSDGLSFDASLYPNPTGTQFTLRLQGVNNQAATLRVTDANGRSLYATKGLLRQVIKFGETFAPGIYMVEVRQGNEIKTLKAVKLK